MSGITHDKNPPVSPFNKGGRKGDFRTRSFIIGLALLLSPGLALAQGGYGSLSYFDWTVDKAYSSKLESATARAVGGYMLNDHFGVEGHIATGGADDFQYQGEDAEAQLNKILAVFAKPNLPLLGGRVNVYGLVGYSFGRVDVLAETTTDAGNQNSFSWGAGADIALIPDRLSVTADYIEYINRSGYEVSGVSLGLKLSFAGQ